MKLPAPFRSCSGWTLAIAAAVILKLWLVAAQPVIAIGPAGHDDRHFLALAQHMLHGEWLGAYNHFTLIKGPAYSLFIAAAFCLGVPLPLAQHLLYLAGCAVIVRALRPHLRPGWPAAAVFLLLWWNPMSYELPVLGRVVRQNLYTPATLFFFAGLFALVTRRDSPRSIRIAWGALLGLAGATLWLTREETIWAAPSAVLLVGFAAWSGWRLDRRFAPLLAPIGVAVGLGLASVGAVCVANYRAYGWFGTVEFRAPAFIAAYGALQRIVPKVPVRRVPITREARQIAYAVSPAFAELRPYLEGEIGFRWAQGMENITGLPPEAHELAGGWSMWALRDAVAAAGHEKSAAEALAFYQRIADEINAAADAGRFAARPRRDTFVPPWGPGHYTRLKREGPAYVWYFLTFSDFSARPNPSVGPPYVLQLFSDLTRWPLASSPEARDLDRPTQTRIDEARISLLDCIGHLLTRGITLLNLFTLAGWAWLGWRALRRRTLDALFVYVTALLGACAAIFLINFLVHLLSFPNRSPGALAQAYPLLLLAGALVALACFDRRGVLSDQTSASPARTPSSSAAASRA